MSEDLLVSIYCRTYNHRGYIRNALDSMLMQNTDFLYKIVIFDDASTDGTSDIVKEYAKKYPQIIQALIMKKNTWHSPQRAKIDSAFMKKYLTGKYIAYCEGDDFWIDPYKLQIQVDYMEAHPECSMYLHNALWFNCIDNTMKAGNPYNCKSTKDVTSEEIFMMYNGHPPTASFLHRKELLDMPNFFLESSVGDYTLLLYALLYGNIHYSNRIMSVYRQLSIGSYSSTIQNDKVRGFYYHFGLLQFCFKYNQFTNYKHEGWCSRKIQEYASKIIQRESGNLIIDNYVRECMDQKYTFSGDFYEYIKELKRLQRQIYDKSYISITLREFTEKYQYIIIMGTGNFATILAEQFANNHIEYNGFAVTKRREGESIYLEKTIWELSEIPYRREDTAVIIGINPVDWSDIKNSLTEAKVLNYYCPFLYDLKNDFDF